MNQPFRLMIDIREGNHDLDYELLLEAGVVDAIVGLNDMVGGHQRISRLAEEMRG